MAGYSRMDIMSMSEEELCRVLKEEGDVLPDHTLCFMVEELKRRKENPQCEETEEDLSETKAFLESWEAENPEEFSDDAEDAYAEENDPENVDGEDADAEEDQEKNSEESLIALQRERRHTLIVALTGAGIAAAGIIGFFLYLYFTGQL